MEDTIYNPWREFIENVINGDNYFRGSEYRELLEELDAFYKQQEDYKQFALAYLEWAKPLIKDPGMLQLQEMALKALKA
jgi:hypothetical protein